MKNQDKMFMAKDMGHFGDSRAPSWLSGPQIDVPTELPSHRLCFRLDFGTVPTMWYILFSIYYCNFGEIEKKRMHYLKSVKSNVLFLAIFISLNFFRKDLQLNMIHMNRVNLYK